VRLIAEGAFFSLPSRPEGFGIAYLEAMAMGLAVIGCQAEGIADLVTEHDIGLLVSGDSAADLAEAWRVLLSDPDACRRFGARGRALVRGHFDWDTRAREILAVYRDLAVTPATEANRRA